MNKETEERLEKRFGHLDTLANIAKDLGINVNTMNRWAERGRKHDFPEPERYQGRFRLYNREHVEEWVYLHLKITRNLGNKDWHPGKKQPDEGGTNG